MTKKTPLYNWHVEHGAKMVEFGGFLMPVSYEGVLTEHQAVREQCGLFDISHMGEIFIQGKGAPEFVQVLTSNDVTRLKDGEAQYSLLLNQTGYPVDDVIVYQLEAERFLLCVNAANIDKDYRWICSQNTEGVRIEDKSGQMGMLALQGPNSANILNKLGFDLGQLERFEIKEAKISEVSLLVSRTGYTGEDGCEFFLANKDVLTLWDALIQAGAEHGLVPVGLGARDTLRLEMGYALYGHELSEEINPLEAGLSWVVKLKNGDFIGKKALQKMKEAGRGRKLVGLVMEEPGIPRQGMAVYDKDHSIGEVLSGTMSPTLKQGIATVLLKGNDIPQNQEILIDIRGKMKKAKIHKFPLVNKL